ncbi:MAG: hypothetical protein V4447_08710 [Pseudomonadota bacterium]
MPPYFLDRLELTAEADERAIKRAYANALKKIDQETEPDAFQELRALYESALAWLAHKPKEASFALPKAPVQVTYRVAQEETPVVVTPPAVAIQKGSPAQTAEQLLQSLLASLSATEIEEPDAVQLLQNILLDERMIELDVRDHFEQLLIFYIGQGWRKGNGNLFGSALKVFGWMNDRQRLLHMGHPGMRLEQAIVELTLFNRQNVDYAQRQLEVIKQLRVDARPDNNVLIYDMEMLGHMCNAFPTWLFLVTNTENIKRWKAWNDEIPKRRKATSPGEMHPEESTSKAANNNSGPKFIYVIMVMAFFSMIGKLATHESFPPPPLNTHAYTQSSQPSVMANRADFVLKFHPVGGFVPVDQRPIPGKISDLQIRRMALGVTDSNNCNDVLEFAYTYRLGSMSQVQDLGTKFDARIVSCVAAGYWAFRTYTDEAVAQANRRANPLNFFTYPAPMKNPGKEKKY